MAPRGIILIISAVVFVAADIDLDKPATVTNVVGVEGGTIILPCPSRSSINRNASVQLVLWFRQGGSSGRPVFSRDARKRGMSSARTSSATPPFGFGDRAISEDEGLRVLKLKAEDASVYRCRVDFSNAPAANHLVNLTIVLPPKSMDILDGNEETSGPSTQRALQEGDGLHLLCRVVGGKPSPEVIWKLDGKIIDSTYEPWTTDTIVNRLNMAALTRHHQGKLLECTARNSELAPPITKFIIIELLLRPLWTRVTSPSHGLVAGQAITVECRSGGSRPPAKLSWWRGGQKVDEASFNYSTTIDGESISFLRLLPDPRDDERYLECRAENLAIQNSVVPDQWKIEVQYPVSAQLRPGAQMRLESLREGDDAFLECAVKGNPHPTHVKWFHDGVPLVPERSAGVLRSQFVLVMRGITRHSAGSYTCFVENILGNSTSNSVHIVVQHAPVCATSSPLVVPSTLGQNATLVCPFTAHPAVLTVRWVQVHPANSSMPSPQIFSFIQHLTFDKVRRSHLGRYLCWGRNTVGEQAQPCKIDFVAPGGSSEVVNCSANFDESHLRVSCFPGEPSGLETNFVMEILALPSGKTWVNVTVPWDPLINLTIPWPPDGIAADDYENWKGGLFQGKIRSVSSQGFGTPFVFNLQHSIDKGLVSYHEASSDINEPLLATVLSSIAALLFVASCVLILILVIRRRRFARQRQAEAAIQRVVAVVKGSQVQTSEVCESYGSSSRSTDKPIVRTPLPKPKMKRVQQELDSHMPLVGDFKRFTIAPSHPTRSLEVGIDQTPYSREPRTLDRRKDPNGTLVRFKSLESCI